MASIDVKKSATGYEATGIERVAEDNRAHTQLWDTMWLWWSANAVVATVATGSIAAFSGLGLSAPSSSSSYLLYLVYCQWRS